MEIGKLSQVAMKSGMSVNQAWDLTVPWNRLEMRQDGNIVASGWVDNKAVFLLSTNADPTVNSAVQHKQKDGTMLETECPVAVQPPHEWCRHGGPEQDPVLHMSEIHQVVQVLVLIYFILIMSASL